MNFAFFLGKKEIFDYYFVQMISLNQKSERNKKKNFGLFASYYDNFEEELIIILFFKKITKLYDIKIILNG